MGTVDKLMLKKGSVVELFKIEESIEFYKNNIDFTEFDTLEFNKISHPEKKIQWLASRYLLKRMTQEEKQLHLVKTVTGKPNFVNLPLFFSITHSHEFVAVILSEQNNVAIDLEMTNPKLQLIKKKFLHPMDCTQGEDTELLTILWSAKESIYKYCDDKFLSFKEHIAILDISDGEIKSEIKTPQYSHSLILHYKKYGNFWLTWVS